MSTEKVRNNSQTATLNDADLNEATGGYTYTEIASTGKYYHWTGENSQRDSKYLCPNCKRGVHYGSWKRYYCDPCDASWYDESRLLPNIGGGSWREISQAEYEEGLSGKREHLYR